jgi:hypothetical protein
MCDVMLANNSMPALPRSAIYIWNHTGESRMNLGQGGAVEHYKKDNSSRVPM